MTKDGAIVQSNMSQAQILAGIDVLCVDKTGTLTENMLTLLEPYTSSCDAEDVILAACLTFKSEDSRDHDPIDKTFIRALKHYPRARDSVGRHKIIDLEPFSIETRRTEALVEAPSGERIFYTKGAPRYVLDLCLRDNSETHAFKEEYSKTVTDIVHRGLRCLGVARKREAHNWELLGVVPIIDAPRFNTISSIKIARALGISVRKFTGDTVAIATEIARSIGMGTNSLESDSLENVKLPCNSETSTLVEEADVYAELFPQHKETIVRILQGRGRLVAATGNDVNDAPTLKRAECGIAVEGAVETAQSAAQFAFTKPGFATIIQAVERSRQIFQLTYSFMVYRTAFALYLVMFLVCYFVTYNETLDPNLLLLIIHSSDIMGIDLCYDGEITPYPRSPVRWTPGGFSRPSCF